VARRETAALRDFDLSMSARVIRVGSGAAKSPQPACSPRITADDNLRPLIGRETLIMSRLILFGVAALFAVLHGPAGASAESYPQRAVRFILPFGPGAGVDITARMLAERLAARWGKPVVVENRPGGDGIVAINVFTSAKDDHTLLFVPTSTFTAHPYTHDKLPYDPQRDLLPIATVTVIVIALASPESLRIASLGDFVAMARALPGTLNAAAAPGNSDLVLAGFLKDMNLQVAKVPYRDIMQAPNDLAESRIQLLMSSYASMRGLIEAGRLKVLAVTSRKRVGIAPAIPTVAEAGFPFLGLDGLIGVFGSRGMSDALRESIAADIKAVVAADPTIAARLGATGQVVDVRGPAEFAANIKEQHDKIADIAQALGIKAAQ
jgi:tripartite-type tricarboxylate transporter receptor subunit TctC